MTPLPPSPNRYLGRHFALRGLRERPLDFIMEMAAQFGDLVYFGSLRTPLCFVNHPNLIREVLVSRSHEFIRADAVRNALRIAVCLHAARPGTSRLYRQSPVDEDYMARTSTFFVTVHGVVAFF